MDIICLSELKKRMVDDDYEYFRDTWVGKYGGTDSVTSDLEKYYNGDYNGDPYAKQIERDLFEDSKIHIPACTIQPRLGADALTWIVPLVHYDDYIIDNKPITFTLETHS
jgi:hypothetical protein